jgi:hypothetical protein
VTLHLPGHRVRPSGLALARAHQRLGPRGVGRQDGIVDLALEKRPERASLRRHGPVVQRVHGGGALAAVAHDAGLAQAAEVGRDARLCEVEHRGQLGDRELVAREERHQADAGGVPEEVQEVDGAGERSHLSVHPDDGMIL